MSDSNAIPLRNVYFMLTYAFRCLRQAGYADLDAKSFPDAKNLFAAILTKGIAQAVKQGLYREYSDKGEILPGIRGRLIFTETIRVRSQNKQGVFCEYDDFTEDNLCGVPHWLDSFLEIDRCKCSGLSTGSGRSKTRPTI